jgi:hypothetical protein
VFFLLHKNFKLDIKVSLAINYATVRYLYVEPIEKYFLTCLVSQAVELKEREMHAKQIATCKLLETFNSVLIYAKKSVTIILQLGRSLEEIYERFFFLSNKI